MPDAWLAAVPGVREHEPLSPHSWYGIGGRARYFLGLDDDATLPELIARLDALSRETVLDGLSVVHPEMWTAMMNSKSLRFQRAMKAVTQRVREIVSWPRSQDKHQAASPMS